MDKPVKKDGTYDGRSKEKRKTKGLSDHPKKTENSMKKALTNNKKHSK